MSECGSEVLFGDVSLEVALSAVSAALADALRPRARKTFPVWVVSLVVPPEIVRTMVFLDVFGL